MSKTLNMMLNHVNDMVKIGLLTINHARYMRHYLRVHYSRAKYWRKP